MKKENKIYLRKILKFTLTFLFIIFLTLYFSMISGYYEYKNYEKMVFTESQIKQFEKDVSDGKNIDLKNYQTNTNKNYQNGISKLGLSLSNVISNGINSGVKGFFKLLIDFIDE